MIVLITGGAQSGKSKFAEQYAAKLGPEGIYVATMERGDEETKRKIERHVTIRNKAGFFRETREVPLMLADELESIRIESRSLRAQRRVILVDCLTMWLSNLLHVEMEQSEHPEEAVHAAVDELAETLKRMCNPVLLVTNEVGDGIVPAYPLGRLYRDLAGQMNQAIAAISDQVFLVTAGIPVELKSMAFRLDEPPEF